LAEYSHLGLSAFSHVDLPLVDIALDRTIDKTGKRRLPTYSSTPSQDAAVYPGFDRFGRIKRISTTRAT
jgi:hypothetical protein